MTSTEPANDEWAMVTTDPVLIAVMCDVDGTKPEVIEAPYGAGVQVRPGTPGRGNGAISMTTVRGPDGRVERMVWHALAYRVEWRALRGQQNTSAGVEAGLGKEATSA